MRKIALFCCLLALLVPFGHRSFAQDAAPTPNAAKPADPPLHSYHLECVVQELGADGKPVNSRAYSTTITTNSHETSVIRANSRVPIVTGSFSAGAKDNESVNTQFQYLDVGVHIDIRNAHEIGRQLTLSLAADVSSIGGTAILGATHEPIIRQNKWESWVLIPIGKPTVVFNSDDLDSKGSMQMVVTATLLQ